MRGLKGRGFTLIELVMVIVIVGILATMTTDIITLPVKSYIDLERRTTLVDSAEMSLRRMQRDIRRALPNSIRIIDTGVVKSSCVYDKDSGDDSYCVIELLHTIDGGRYRANSRTDTSDPGDVLDFTDPNDNSFDVIGVLNNAPTKGELVIYNVGSLGADAYDGKNRRSIVNTSTINKLVFNLASPAKPFPFSSPEQRFFIVDTPVAYRCENGELRRYDNTIDTLYNISSAAPSFDGLGSKLQAKSNEIECEFTYDPGTNSTPALVTLGITLTDEADESVTLRHQVHIDNVP